MRSNRLLIFYKKNHEAKIRNKCTDYDLTMKIKDMPKKNMFGSVNLSSVIVKLLLFIIITSMTLVILPLSKEIAYTKEINSVYVNLTSTEDKVQAGNYYQQVQMSGQNMSSIDDDFSLNYTEAGGIATINYTYSFNSRTNELHFVSNYMPSNTTKLTNDNKDNLKHAIITNGFFEREMYDFCNDKNRKVDVTGDALSYKLSIKNSNNTQTCSWSDNSSFKEEPLLVKLTNIADTIKKFI
jgi:hypothetical protein